MYPVNMWAGTLLKVSLGCVILIIASVLLAKAITHVPFLTQNCLSIPTCVLLSVMPICLGL